MMLSNSKLEYVDGDGDGDNIRSNRKLLRDIEEISKALYVRKTTQGNLVPSYVVRTRSVEKPLLAEGLEANLKSRVTDENVSSREKKSLSVWNWKRPLKALSHIGHHKFNVCFFLHVYSIEGLPCWFNGHSLSVIWERKDELVQTNPSVVLNGIAEFDETLMHKCCVYGSRTGPQHLAKYDMKLSSIYASMVGSARVDMGKQWVDLTRLLPLTFEELEGEKSSGKWVTVLKLTGKAKGAVLNISFGFTVVKDNSLEPRSNTKRLMNYNLYEMEPDTRGNRMLQHAGSVPTNLNRGSLDTSPSHDEKSKILGLELSESINFLYEKLNGEKLLNSHVQQIKSRPGLELEFNKYSSDDDSDNSEFTVIDHGIETSEKGVLGLRKGNFGSADDLRIEIINFNEVFGDEDITVEDDIKYSSEDNMLRDNRGQALVDDSEVEKSDYVCNKQSDKDNGDASFPISASLKEKFPQQEDYDAISLNNKVSNAVERSLSLDETTESVANDFLNMLRIETYSSRFNSDSVPESPREQLLREFEKEALASFNFILDCDAEQATEDSGYPSSMSGSIGTSTDSSFSFGSWVPEETRQEESHLLSRRKAKALEMLETEALMGEWGLSEKDFQNSADFCSGGFGSPVELLPE